jgi:hypothetical protein
LGPGVLGVLENVLACRTCSMGVPVACWVRAGRTGRAEVSTDRLFKNLAH